MNTLKKLAAVAALAITATSAVAEDLIVATDTAFVPFEFTSALISICGTQSQLIWA